MNNKQKYLEAAVEHFQAGEHAESIRLCEIALLRHPDAGRIWELCGTAYWLIGDVRRATEALEEASILCPLAPLAQLALASAYAARGKTDLAKMILLHLESLVNLPAKLLPKLAAMLGKAGEFKSALAVCERIVENQPNYHPAWFGIAYYKRSLKHSRDEVVTALQNAHRIAPEFRTYRVNLAICLAESEAYRQAYEVIRTLPLEEVRCRHWLRALANIFEAVDDHERLAATRLLLTDPAFQAPLLDSQSGANVVQEIGFDWQITKRRKS